MKSTSGITKVRVTRYGNWCCHPIFHPQNWRPFLVIVTTPTLSAFQVIISPVSGALCTIRPQKMFSLSSGCHPLNDSSSQMEHRQQTTISFSASTINILVFHSLDKKIRRNCVEWKSNFPGQCI